jgi:hypothetical protein
MMPDIVLGAYMSCKRLAEALDKERAISAELIANLTQQRDELKQSREILAREKDEALERLAAAVGLLREAVGNRYVDDDGNEGPYVTSSWLMRAKAAGGGVMSRCDELGHAMSPSEKYFGRCDVCGKSLLLENEASMTDELEPIRFARYIDETRNIVLRGRHWYVQDAGQAERLWSLSEGSEDSMADEIERLQNLNDALYASETAANQECEIAETELDRCNLTVNLLTQRLAAAEARCDQFAEARKMVKHVANELYFNADWGYGEECREWCERVIEDARTSGGE